MSDKCTWKRCQMQAGVIDPENCKAETCAYRSTEREEALEDLLRAHVMLLRLQNTMLRHKVLSDMDAEFYCRQDQKNTPPFRRLELECEIKDLETAIKAVDAQIRAIDPECATLPENMKEWREGRMNLFLKMHLAEIENWKNSAKRRNEY